MLGLLGEVVTGAASDPNPWTALAVAGAAVLVSLAGAVPRLVDWVTRKPATSPSETKSAAEADKKHDSGKTARIVADQLRRAGVPVKAPTPTEGERIAALEAWRAEIDAWRKTTDDREEKLLDRSEKILALLEKEDRKEQAEAAPQPPRKAGSRG